MITQRDKHCFPSVIHLLLFKRLDNKIASAEILFQVFFPYIEKHAVYIVYMSKFAYIE